MHEEFIELAIHTLLLAFYGVLTVSLAAASAVIEYNSYAIVNSGNVLLAGWVAAIGVVVLSFAYFMLRDKAMSEYRYLTGSSLP